MLSNLIAYRKKLLQTQVEVQWFLQYLLPDGRRVKRL